MSESPEMSEEFSASLARRSQAWNVRINRIKFLLIRYWWVIAICALIGLAVAGYLCVIQPSRYVSVARMMLNGHISMPQEGGDVYNEDVVLFYGTQVALMNSSDTYQQAVSRVRHAAPRHGSRPGGENGSQPAAEDLGLRAAGHVYQSSIRAEPAQCRHRHLSRQQARPQGSGD